MLSLIMILLTTGIAKGNAGLGVPLTTLTPKLQEVHAMLRTPHTLDHRAHNVRQDRPMRLPYLRAIWASDTNTGL